MEVLLFKDSDLELEKICYKDQGGNYSKIGFITDWIMIDGVLISLLIHHSGAIRQTNLNL
jgi:hypothetical protein